MKIHSTPLLSTIGLHNFIYPFLIHHAHTHGKLTFTSLLSIIGLHELFYFFPIHHAHLQSNSSPCVCTDRASKGTLYILYRCQYYKTKYICTVLYRKQTNKINMKQIILYLPICNDDSNCAS